MHLFRHFLIGCALGLVACSARAASLPPIQPVAHVDLPRFMGKWYLIATIPTSYGKDAYNAVETYTLQKDGNIHTTFGFHDGGFDGPYKHIESTGYVQSGTGNAEWRVQLFWFVKAQYIVAYLKPDYSEMIVARDKRDYAWVFARTPQVSPGDYACLVAKVNALGYPTDKLRKVPQRWPHAPSNARAVQGLADMHEKHLCGASLNAVPGRHGHLQRHIMWQVDLDVLRRVSLILHAGAFH